MSKTPAMRARKAVFRFLLILGVVSALGVLLSVAVGTAAVDPAPEDPILAFAADALAASGANGFSVGVRGPSGWRFASAARSAGIFAECSPVLIGSVRTSFTALLVHDLGIDPDAPAIAYLPSLDFDLPAGVRREDITVGMLVEQTSGIAGEEVGAEPAADTKAPALLSSIPVVDRPGRRFLPSSRNDLILGAIIEAETGRSYADVLGERVLDPLGMVSSAVEWPAGRPVAPHAAVFGFPVPIARAPPDRIGAAEGMVSSAGDLARYVELHLGAAPQSGGAAPQPGGAPAAVAVASALRPGPVVSEDLRYAAGWMVGSADGLARYYQTGDEPSYHSSLGFVPELNAGFVIVTDTGTLLQSLYLQSVAQAIFDRIVAGAGGADAESGPLLSYRPLALLAGILIVSLFVQEIFAFGEIDRKVSGFRRRRERPGRKRRRLALEALLAALLVSLFAMFLMYAPLGPMFAVQPDLIVALILAVILFVARSTLTLYGKFRALRRGGG